MRAYEFVSRREELLSVTIEGWLSPVCTTTSSRLHHLSFESLVSFTKQIHLQGDLITLVAHCEQLTLHYLQRLALASQGASQCLQLHATDEEDKDIKLYHYIIFLASTTSESIYHLNELDERNVRLGELRGEGAILLRQFDP